MDSTIFLSSILRSSYSLVELSIPSSGKEEISLFLPTPSPPGKREGRGKRKGGEEEGEEGEGKTNDLLPSSPFPLPFPQISVFLPAHCVILFPPPPPPPPMIPTSFPQAPNPPLGHASRWSMGEQEHVHLLHRTDPGGGHSLCRFHTPYPHAPVGQYVPECGQPHSPHEVEISLSSMLSKIIPSKIGLFRFQNWLLQ